MKLFSSFDLIGMPFTFNIDGDSNHKTFVGFILTLLTIGVSIFSVWDLLLDYINEQNPSISQWNRYNHDPVLIGSSSNGTNMVSFSFELIEPESLRTSSVPKENISPPAIQYSSNKSNFFDTISLLESQELCKKCNMPIYSNHLNTKMDNAGLYLVYFPYMFYKDYFSKLPSSKSLFFSLNSNITMLDSSNPNLVERYPAKNVFHLDTNEQAFYRVTFKKETYMINRSMKSKIGSNNYTYYSVDTIKKEIKRFMPNGFNSNDDFMMYISLENDSNEISFMITYVTESMLLSSFGGSIGVIMTVSSILNSMLSQYTLKAYLINKQYSIYTVDSSNKDESEQYSAEFNSHLEIYKCNNQEVSQKLNAQSKKFKLLSDNRMPSSRHELSGKDILLSCLSSKLWHSKMTLKDKIIKKLVDYFDICTEYTSVIKGQLDISILKSWKMPEEYSHLLNFPRIYLNRSRSLSYLEEQYRSIDPNTLLRDFEYTDPIVLQADFSPHKKEKLLESLYNTL